MAVVQKAFVGLQEHLPYQLMKQVELLTLLAPAAYRIGRDELEDAFFERVQQLIPIDEVARLVEGRLKEWSA